MKVVGVEAPGAPGPGEVLVAPEAVGLCGSDFHYFLGDIGTIDDASTSSQNPASVVRKSSQFAPVSP